MIAADANTDERLAYLLDGIFSVAEEWHDLPVWLHQLAEGSGVDLDEMPGASLRWALGYFLDETTRQGRAEVQLSWKTGSDAATAPPHRSPTGEKMLDQWERLAALVTHPAAAARLRDLLTQGGRKVPHQSASAISHYLQHVRQPQATISLASGAEVTRRWSQHAVDLSLGRALTLLPIAKATPAGRPAADQALRTGLDTAAAAIRSPHSQAGTAMSMLRLLTGNRNHLALADRDELLAMTDEAAARYSDLDHVIDELAELQIQLDPGRREAARRMQVQVRLNAAAALAPMIQMLRLEEAAGLARDYHLVDLRAEAVRRMQQLSNADFGFEAVTSEATVPGEIRDRQVRMASDGANWRQALANWLNTPSPSGSRSANEQDVRVLTHRSFARTLRSHHFGAGQLPRWHAITEAEKDAADLAWFESLHCAVNGEILAEALDRIVRYHGVPEERELTLFLSENGADADLAAALARALRRYWAGDLEGALHTSAVRVEAAARNVVLLLDEPAFTVANNDTQGRFVGLDQLLDILLRHDFDEDWDRYLRTLLLGPTGQNLRHAVAHGLLLTPPTAATAALRACLRWRSADLGGRSLLRGRSVDL
ncbi:hypothetical protein E1258_31510 [Micromonospora sp. KC207]|uniref:hypothetical protein n=1 Tax=Micromonospora sp. KC207 TaxID=2530377 RepID=UPI001047BBF2|nr:hypothetical protein [Micromonospora sp. KC207]TDC44595.1 hypothetical protein E1258_31510 [Micromonospora sp. KC207]